MRKQSSTSEPSTPSEREVASRANRFGILRIAEFAVASGVGFLIAEGILVSGVLFFYHSIKVPSVAFSSPSLLGLDALAFGVGATVAFIINERVTVRGQGEETRKGVAAWIARLCKYQLIALLGNILIVAVQLALLGTTSLSPVLGSVVGAVVTYPVAYVVSMRLVWKVSPLGS